MRLSPLDWTIVFAFLAVALGVGVVFARRASSSAGEYFLSGRSMPWWLLGVSMVATTFSTDTPNLVADIVRTRGVAGNWVWWSFLLTGMVTTFVYARMWRRSGVTTDVGFYELRYSGRAARFLRGFRAVYLGGFFNIMIMASVTLATIKIGSVLLGAPPLATVAVAGTATVLYSMLGGLTGVLITDFVLFGVAMAGSVLAAVWALRQPQVGGLEALLAHPAVEGKLAMLPDFSDPASATAIFFIPIFVLWWSVWYPGSEPGGGGYVAQRMLAARSEGHAQGATLFFNIAHYALRPWPWILVALASLVVFPDLASLQSAFPEVDPGVIGHDLAYPAMLTLLPTGILGLVVASLLGAYMSTISTHLNWGASYLVHDLWQRFIEPEASERRLVVVGKVATVVSMALACLVSLWLTNALQAFQILLQIGAGTGLLFLLRWFWWRVNAAAEIVAMAVSFLVALYFQFFHTLVGGAPLDGTTQLALGVGMTTCAWLATAWLTKPTEDETLEAFVAHVRPAGPGWRRTRERAAARGVTLPPPSGGLLRGLSCAALGAAAVYCALFSTGSALYGRGGPAVLLALGAIGAGLGVVRLWRAQTP